MWRQGGVLPLLLTGPECPSSTLLTWLWRTPHSSTPRLRCSQRPSGQTQDRGDGVGGRLWREEEKQQDFVFSHLPDNRSHRPQARGDSSTGFGYSPDKKNTLLEPSKLPSATCLRATLNNTPLIIPKTNERWFYIHATLNIRISAAVKGPVINQQQTLHYHLETLICMRKDKWSGLLSVFITAAILKEIYFNRSHDDWSISASKSELTVSRKTQ